MITFRTPVFSFFLAVSALFMASAFAPSAALAQEDGQVKIAILDMATALFNSDVAARVNQQVQTENASDLQKVRDLETQAQALQERLNTDGEVMSNAERQGVVAELQELNVQYEYLIQRIETVVQQRRQQFEQTYTPNLIQAISAVVDEQQIDLVLRAEVVLHYRSAFDITAMVTEKLNQQQAAAGQQQ